MPAVPGCLCQACYAGDGHESAPTVPRFAGPSTRRATQDTVDRLTAESRKTCTACDGHATRCVEGTGHPRFERLPGCAAYTADGTLAATKAPRAPRQPWETRKAA